VGGVGVSSEIKLNFRFIKKVYNAVVVKKLVNQSREQSKRRNIFSQLQKSKTSICKQFFHS
jgi:hypothetical protein